MIWDTHTQKKTFERSKSRIMKFLERKEADTIYFDNEGPFDYFKNLETTGSKVTKDIPLVPHDEAHIHTSRENELGLTN